MPKFEVRVESPDLMQENGSPQFRVYRFVADDEDAARHRVKIIEYSHCAYEMPAEELVEALEVEADPEQVLQGAAKGRLSSHRQVEPYAVVSVRDITRPGAPAVAGGKG